MSDIQALCAAEHERIRMDFDGHHFRPDTGKGVPEYGWYITAEGLPSVVIPGDTRDYSALPEVPKADICFAHVWLGDGLEDAPVHPLAREVASLSPATRVIIPKEGDILDLTTH
ncbi:MAG: hypothetical protein K5647_10555 [Clostridiales bacterium]|nr:hypothetical protein [Clostridiales bacterium]